MSRAGNPIRYAVAVMWLTASATACGAGAGSREETVVTIEDSFPDDASLLKELDALWELDMRRHPTWATYEGDRRFDDQLGDPSPEAAEAYVAEMEAIAARVEAIPVERLSPTAQDTRQMVVMTARSARARRVCRDELWKVHGLGGPQVDFGMLPVFHGVHGPTDLANLEARYRATGAYVDQVIANLREGLALGYRPPRVNVERALQQLDRLLEGPVDADPMLRVSFAEGVELDTAGVRDAVETVARPALSRYRAVLREEVLTKAGDAVGVGAQVQGEACYRAAVAEHLGADYDPRALHELGLRELAVAQSGMVETARALGFEVDSAAEAIAAVRGAPEHYARGPEELLSRAEAAVDAADAAVIRVFGRLPSRPVRVREMEAHRAVDAPAAYYYAGPAQGDRPAYYYVNTWEATHRPLYDAEVLAFHEAVPGHHLQIALAQELPELHVWRRHASTTAFVEGWALYAELLADELGLYPTALARFGMVNFQAWRAARLVVDTGMHHMGWSREEALGFLVSNTALPEQEAANEIDRYIAWPGQALAYMVGRLEIQDMRRRAEAQLGEGFDLRAFHDTLLQQGALPLPLVRSHVEAWAAAGGTRSGSDADAP